MADFLSPEWIDLLDEAASSNESLRTSTADAAFVLQQTVTDTPTGDVSWYVEVDHGRVQVRPGVAPRADVTFTQKDETARAIGNSEMSAQAAFMLGRLRIGGDVAILMDQRTAFDGLDDVFADVRSVTTY
jgi:putative sterol carrier protein